MGSNLKLTLRSMFTTSSSYIIVPYLLRQISDLAASTQEEVSELELYSIPFHGVSIPFRSNRVRVVERWNGKYVKLQVVTLSNNHTKRDSTTYSFR